MRKKASKKLLEKLEREPTGAELHKAVKKKLKKKYADKEAAEEAHVALLTMSVADRAITLMAMTAEDKAAALASMPAEVRASTVNDILEENKRQAHS